MGGAFVSDERFSYMPAAVTHKFQRSHRQDFSKAKAPCIDEFLMIPSKGTNSLNAFNQIYAPNYDYNRKSIVSMIP